MNIWVLKKFPKVKVFANFSLVDVHVFPQDMVVCKKLFKQKKQKNITFVGCCLLVVTYYSAQPWCLSNWQSLQPKNNFLKIVLQESLLSSQVALLYSMDCFYLVSSFVENLSLNNQPIQITKKKNTLSRSEDLKKLKYKSSSDCMMLMVSFPVQIKASIFKASRLSPFRNILPIYIWSSAVQS